MAMEPRRARNVPISLRNPSITVSNVVGSKRLSSLAGSKRLSSLSGLDNRKSLKSVLERTCSITMNYQNYDHETDGENLCKAAILVLTKISRSFNENAILIGYLKTLLPLVKMLKDAVNEVNYEDLLKNISFVLKYDYFDDNRILFRYGDKGDKFYLILKGQVAILIPKDEKIELSEEEYFLYLLKLRRYNELEMLNNTLYKNKYIFKIDEEDFDTWISTAIEDFQAEENEAVSNSKNFMRQNSIYQGASIINLNSKYSILKKKSINLSNQNPVRKVSRVKKLLQREIEDVHRFIKDKDHMTDSAVTVKDYIERLKPVVDDTTLYGERKLVSVWSYNHILSLNDGDKFGDFALDSFSQKRSATIITTQPTHFGTMNKKNYTDCIKDVNEKVKKNNINFVLSLQVFKNGNSHLFMKNYYNFLVLRKINWREKICVEGADPENVYFIKEGEFEISMRKSNFMIDEVIKTFRNGDDSHISETEKELSWNDTKDYNRFMGEKKSSRLFIIKNSDVIGLNDAIYKEKYLYNVECVSVTGEVFEMKSKIFKMLCDIDQGVNKSTKDFEVKKIMHMLDRLTAIRNMRYTFYKNFKNSRLEEEQAKANLFCEKKEKSPNKEALNSSSRIRANNSGGINDHHPYDTQDKKRAVTSLSSSKGKRSKARIDNKEVSSSTSLLNSRLIAERNKSKKLSKNKVIKGNNKEDNPEVNLFELNSMNNNYNDMKANSKKNNANFNSTTSNKFNLPTFEINAASGEIKTMDTLTTTFFGNTNINASLKSVKMNANMTAKAYANTGTVDSTEGMSKTVTLLKKNIFSNSHASLPANAKSKEYSKDMNSTINTNNNTISNACNATDYTRKMNNTNTTISANNVLSTFYNDANATGASRNNPGGNFRDTLYSNGRVLKSIIPGNATRSHDRSNKELISICANGRYQVSNSLTNTKTDSSNALAIDTEIDYCNTQTVKEFVTINSEEGSNTFNNTASTNQEYYSSIFKPCNANTNMLTENTINNNTNSKEIDLYAEIERVSRNFNQTPYKNYSRGIFEKVFQSYMPNSPSNRLSTSNNNNSNSNLTHSPGKKLITKLISRKVPLEECLKPNSEKSNVVDCLVMDNFNRIYNTIYYYSNVFNPLFTSSEVKNKNSHRQIRQMSNDHIGNRSRKANVNPSNASNAYKYKIEDTGSATASSRNKLFEKSRNMMNDKAKLIYSSKRKVN